MKTKGDRFHHTSIWCHETNEILESICAKFSVPKSSLLEVLLLGANEAGLDLTDVIVSGKAKREIVNPDGRKLRMATLSKLASLPPAELERLIAHAKGTEAS
jgi:hypothetical protein